MAKVRDRISLIDPIAGAIKKRLLFESFLILASPSTLCTGVTLIVKFK
jgi:hypothetical protein